MTEEKWLAAKNPRPMIKFLRGKTSERKLLLFVHAFLRGLEGILVDKWNWANVEKAELKSTQWAVLQEMIADLKWRRVEEQDFENAVWAREMERAIRNSQDGCDKTIQITMTLANRKGLPLLSTVVRDLFGNPFRPITLNPTWLTSTVLSLAGQMYDSRDFCPMPILADALQDAGCDNADILQHCRGPGPHVRGCWVVDKLLSKE
jgi:hypothetical protein